MIDQTTINQTKIGETKFQSLAPAPAAAEVAKDLLGLPVDPQPAAKRQRNELFDAFAKACGSDPDQLTKTGARAFGVALAEIKAVMPDVTPAEFPKRAAYYCRHFSKAALTASALSKHWAQCANSPMGWGQGDTGTSPSASNGANRHQMRAPTAAEHGKGWFHPDNN